MSPSRRFFLAAAGGTLAGLGGLFRPAVADELRKAQMRAVLVWMAGGPSQLETWDPKPGTASAGPHGTRSTAIRGVGFDEYMPRLAGLADRLAVVHSVTSTNGEHGQATVVGQTGAPPGRRPVPPAWLAACAHELAGEAWPAFVSLGRGGRAAGSWARGTTRSRAPATASRPRACRPATPMPTPPAAGTPSATACRPTSGTATTRPGSRPTTRRTASSAP